MIDQDGYRANVGIMLINGEKQLLWAKRCHQANAWQFPQGGIDENEQPIDALWRELKEELGLEPQHVEVIAESQHWYRYRLPKKFIRRGSKPLCIGQKQRWFLLELTADPSAIQLDQFDPPEFDRITWVGSEQAIAEVINFKREVYRKALTEFSAHL